MFENLTDKLNAVFKKVTGKGKLTEANVKDALREVRLALLEADVNYRVVKQIIQRISDRAIGHEVMQSLTPGQQIIKIVSEELTSLMGGEASTLQLIGRPPFSLMLVGLQGSGKTTTAAKIAMLLRRQGRHPYLVPADIYRPAAIDQLEKLGKSIQVPVYPSDPAHKPEDICLEAMSEAGRQGSDVLIIDTAGRLHIDDDLMDELGRIKRKINPVEILLVADAMTGQDAVNVAKKFDEILDITGVILSKMEGDARGGAALSIKAVTGKPIKFVGIGEQIGDLEVFHPERVASQILGMGDMLSLIEKAQSQFDEKEAERLQKKLKQNKFDLDDFLSQLRQMKKIGSLEQIMSMIPGLGQNKKLKQFKPDEKELIKVEAIINSMTKQERQDYRIIKGSRKKRIARGSGVKIQDVNRLLKNFAQSKKMIERLTRKGYDNNIMSMFK